MSWPPESTVAWRDVRSAKRHQRYELERGLIEARKQAKDMHGSMVHGGSVDQAARSLMLLFGVRPESPHQYAKTYAGAALLGEALILFVKAHSKR